VVKGRINTSAGEYQKGRKTVGFKTKGVMSDSAAVMVKARESAGKKYSLVPGDCKFHSTDLAAGALINSSIPWLKQAVDDASFVTSYITRRSRAARLYDELRAASNKSRRNKHMHRTPKLVSA